NPTGRAFQRCGYQWCGGGGNRGGGGDDGGGWGGGRGRGGFVARPQGSFSRSCRQCRVHGAHITCQCRTVDGSWERTSINWRRCPGGSLTNRDGQLQCGR